MAPISLKKKLFCCLFYIIYIKKFCLHLYFVYVFAYNNCCMLCVLSVCVSFTSTLCWTAQEYKLNNNIINELCTHRSIANNNKEKSSNYTFLQNPNANQSTISLHSHSLYFLRLRNELNRSNDYFGSSLAQPQRAKTVSVAE